ncbi:hypothetical protein K493DRAFT_319513 [Basidiobolus meristosporus CBS 931.73]|uniref:Zn(2)-C6 fungal-type domain-containing protein n=1 Tax=Basidiobolus meristosporus CBS 931.73 TaxID=1314790 RepID=A0A1Y1XRK3_9FUNG|nr:hypothetical protein K493DRAFT_319513 [Basidiobolus meristosporus CBS 931.73]|eukprot:ORX88388.1 hypothetical protein K493DRAFT_319513 [Basidiobolus meristosporus CBS 931.73]
MSAINSTEAPELSKPTKRKRLTQACDTCRKKKIKCDGDRTGCSNCARLKVDCTYLPSLKKRGPRQGQSDEAKVKSSGHPGYRGAVNAGFSNPLKMNGTIQSVSLRPVATARHSSSYLRNLPRVSNNPENLFISHNNTSQGGKARESTATPPCQASKPTSRSLSGSSQGEEETIREKVEQVWSHSYLGNTSGLSALAPNNGNEGTPSPKQHSSDNHILGATSLPPTEITEHLLTVYFSTIHPHMPFIHKPTFFTKFKNGEIPPILILSICACVSRFSNHPGILADPIIRSGEIFSNRFRNILLKCLDGPSVFTTEALLIVSYYEYMNARYPRAWMYLGMAIRMAQELGINRIDENGNIPGQSSADWVEVETQRRLWWSCFIRDRIGSTGTGRPMAIDEHDSRVLLPSFDSDWENGRPVPGQLLEIADQTNTAYSSSSLSNNMASPWSIFIRLAALMGKTSQFVNSPKDCRENSAESDSKFAFLDSALTSWSMSLPQNLQYTTNMLTDKSSTGYAQAAFICTLHIMYHTSIILLHRSSLDRVENQPIYSAATSFASESLERCISSANAISAIIQDFDKFPACYNYPHICFCIFNGGTIHVHTLFSSKNAEVIADAKAKLEIHYQVLQRLKSVWIMAEKYCAILKGIVALGQKPAAVSPNTNSLVQEMNQNAVQVGFAFEQPLYRPTQEGRIGRSKDRENETLTPNFIPNGFQMIPDLNSPNIRIADGTTDFSTGFQNLLDLPIAEGNTFFDTLFGNIMVDSNQANNLITQVYNQQLIQSGSIRDVEEPSAITQGVCSGTWGHQNTTR